MVFILDLIPATTGSSVVFPFPLYSSFIPSLPFLIPPSFYSSVSFSSVKSQRRSEGNAPEDICCQRHIEEVSSSLTVCSSCPSFFQPMRKEPEVVTVTLKKHNGMGLSIVAAKVGNVTWMEV